MAGGRGGGVPDLTAAGVDGRTGSARGGRMTPFVLASLILIWLSYGVGWLWGGRTERAAVLVLFLDHALTRATIGMPGAHELVAASESMVALTFAWLAFRSSRWWTLVALAASLLCILVFILEWTEPGLSRYAAVSARTGLWFVISLSLLAGVAERWLAGEPPVSAAARWRRSKVA